MEQEILSIFYNQVIPEADTGVIQIDGWNFNIGFSLQINDCCNSNSIINQNIFLEKDIISRDNAIVLMIQNLKKFQKLLVEYTEKMYSFIIHTPTFHTIDNLYFNGKRACILKAILSTVWINATEENFKNPEYFLEKRIAFLEDKTSLQYLGIKTISKNIFSLDNSAIIAEIKKQNPFTHETPYVFTSKIQNDVGEFFELPNISYGIYNNQCFIYSIQKTSLEKDQKGGYQKKINRLLYRANKDVLDDYEEENIKDISQPHLFALTLFFKFINAPEVIVPNYLPIRYNAKIRALDNKIKKMESNLSKKELEDMKNQLEQEIDFIQENITQKYLRIFRRLEYHFPNFKIISYPYDVDNHLHVQIKKIDLDKNHILYDVYNSIDFEKTVDRKRSI